MSSNTPHNLGIAIHGGAGTILRSEMTPEKEALYTDGLATALDRGYEILAEGGTALDAVEAAVIELENCPLFNAGRGSVFNAKGAHEMDACIMDGKSLDAGSVAAISNLKNPIQLARRVLTHSHHVFLIGDGANEFAKQHDFSFEKPEYFHVQERFDQWQRIKDSDKFELDHVGKAKQYLGTVGAVALDAEGNLAAATSTGGMTNKKFGRVGDSPILGAGNYANNSTCAVSCTGSGEYLMRGVIAHDISCLMKYKGLTLAEATDQAVMKTLVELGGDAGVISIDHQGNINLQVERTFRHVSRFII